MGNAISDIQLWIICVISQIDVKTSGAGNVTTRKLFTWGAAGASFLSFSKVLCVCQSRICSLSPIYCCLSKLHKQLKAPACQKHHLKPIRAKVDHVIDCVFLPAHVISRAGIHTVCVWSAWEWSTQSLLLRGPDVRIASVYHCVHFAPGGFSSRREPSSAFLAVMGPPPLRRSGGCICGFAVDLAEGMETGVSLSSSSPARSIAHSLGSDAHSAVSSPQRAGSALLLSSSEGEDVESADYSLLQSPQFDELLHVVTRAVTKLNIDWPAENQTEQQKSKLDERFLRSKSLAPRRSMLFFPDLHTLRCRDSGGTHFHPAYLSLPLIIMEMWRGWVSVVQSDAPGWTDTSVTRCGIVSEGSSLALQAAVHNISTGGQGVHVVYVPSRSAERTRWGRASQF